MGGGSFVRNFKASMLIPVSIILMLALGQAWAADSAENVVHLQKTGKSRCG